MDDPQLDRDVDEFVFALLQLDRVGADRLLRRAGNPGDGVLGAENVVSLALERIGAQWERGEVSLAQVYLTGKACAELLRAWIPPAPVEPSGALALVVLEDQHVLGASLVRSVLSCAGLAPAYWGSMDASAACARVVAESPTTLLISTLMLRSALRVKQVVQSIRRAGLPTRVIVGGAPFRFDPTLWQEVGADAMGRTAADALALTRSFAGRAA